MTGPSPIDPDLVEVDPLTGRAVTSPIDTIREALALHKSMHYSGEGQSARSVQAWADALAALTEVEHQLAGHKIGQASLDAMHRRAVAAETALAEANARAKICPYCAHAFEPQEGRTYSACPGCDRANNLEEVLQQIVDPSYVGNYRAETVVEIYRRWAKDAVSRNRL